MEQRSNEWFEARLGKVTASRIADVLSKIKTGESASRKNYRAQLVLERLTGVKEETYMNQAMQDGVDREDIARILYEVATRTNVAQAPFVDHPTVAMSGASPDGIVNDGLIEIKCPIPATHLETLLTDGIPSRYYPQMMWQMACTGAKWNDFVSFNPLFPDAHQLVIRRLHRDEKVIAEYEAAVNEFNLEVDALIAKLNDTKGS